MEAITFSRRGTRAACCARQANVSAFLQWADGFRRATADVYCPMEAIRYETRTDERITKMTREHLRYLSIAVVGVGVFAAVWLGRGAAQQASGDVKIDADNIGGTVTSAKGPEAGVWVVAETTDLPTKFVRIVVTDDR